MQLHGVLQKARKVDKIYCAPGNAGIAEYAECADIGAMEFEKTGSLCQRKRDRSYYRGNG